MSAPTRLTGSGGGGGGGDGGGKRFKGDQSTRVSSVEKEVRGRRPGVPQGGKDEASASQKRSRSKLSQSSTPSSTSEASTVVHKRNLPRQGRPPPPPHLSHPLGDIRAILKGSIGLHPMTRAESVQALKRIDAQIAAHRENMKSYMIPEAIHINKQEFIDALEDNQTAIVDEVLKTMDKVYAKACRKLNESMGFIPAQQARPARPDIDLIKDIRDEFNQRWAVMEKKRYAIELDLQYHRECIDGTPLMEYPGPTIPIWSPDDIEPFDDEAYNPPFNQCHNRHGMLVQSLGYVRDSFTSALKSDLDKCRSSGDDPSARVHIGALLQRVYVRNFLRQDASWEENGNGGLIINGAGFDYEGPVSTLSAFMATCAFEDKKAGNKHTMLMYAAGCRSCDDSALQLKGVLGLLRSLCIQLLCALPFAINLHFIAKGGTALLTEFRQGDVHTLCRLFRSLLCDVADYIHLRQWGSVENEQTEARTITVVIDGIHFLEDDELDAFCIVVDWFRSITDEVSYGNLLGVMAFKYILIHPGVSKLLQFPYPCEMPVVVLEPE